MILFRPGSILTRPVSMINGNKESPKDVQSSLGAHSYWQRCCRWNWQLESWATFVKQRITVKSGQNVSPVTQTRKRMADVTSWGQVAVMAKCSRPSHTQHHCAVLLYKDTSAPTSLFINAGPRFPASSCVRSSQSSISSSYLFHSQPPSHRFSAPALRLDQRNQKAVRQIADVILESWPCEVVGPELIGKSPQRPVARGLRARRRRLCHRPVLGITPSSPATPARRPSCLSSSSSPRGLSRAWLSPASSAEPPTRRAPISQLPTSNVNNECARRRSVCSALLLLIRDSCLKLGAVVLSGDFSKAVERDTLSGDSGDRRISPLEAACCCPCALLTHFRRHAVEPWRWAPWHDWGRSAAASSSCLSLRTSGSSCRTALVPRQPPPPLVSRPPTVRGTTNSGFRLTFARRKRRRDASPAELQRAVLELLRCFIPCVTGVTRVWRMPSLRLVWLASHQLANFALCLFVFSCFTVALVLVTWLPVAWAASSVTLLWPVSLHSVRGVSVAILPHSSFRVTVLQGVVFGGAEDEVVERGACHNDEIGEENAKEAGQDDMADQGWWWTSFMRTPVLTLCHVLSHKMGVKNMETLAYEVYAVYTLPSVTVDLIDCKRKPTATTKIQMARWPVNLLRPFFCCFM